MLTSGRSWRPRWHWVRGALARFLCRWPVPWGPPGLFFTLPVGAWSQAAREAAQNAGSREAARSAKAAGWPRNGFANSKAVLLHGRGFSRGMTAGTANQFREFKTNFRHG